MKRLGRVVVQDRGGEWLKLHRNRKAPITAMPGSRKACHIAAIACDGGNFWPPATLLLAIGDAPSHASAGRRRSRTRNQTAKRLTPQESPAIRNPACCMPHWL